MKAKILFKEIEGNTPTECMQELRKSFPNARLISAKYSKTYETKRVPKGIKRSMIVAFVDDADLVWEAYK